MNQHRGKYIICLIFALTGCLLYVNASFAVTAAVSVNLPAESQAYKPGDTVTISGTAQNLAEVSVAVFNGGGGSVYSSQRTVSNGQFSTGFTLASDAIEGNYKIRIGGLGLTTPYERNFLVQQNAVVQPSVTVSAPVDNQTFKPGDIVTISGTTQNLTEVSVAVFNGGGGSVYSTQVAASSGQFSTGFTLASDAIEGNYKIRIGGLGLSTPYERNFIVQQNTVTPSVTVSLPTDNQIYKPGDAVTITGTATNLTGVSITVFNEGGNTVTSSQPSVIGGQFSTSFTLASDASEGTYNIQINGQGLSTPYERNFRVQGIDECFIATASFGSKFEPSVVLLRQFRDQYLLNNSPGQAFVKFYYKNSPPIAAFIAQNESLKAIVRGILTPVVGVVYLFMHPKMAFALAGILLLVILIRKITRGQTPSY